MKDSNINLRMDPALKRRVEAASDKLGMNPSAVMRMLLGQFLDHCERHGGKIVMPPDFVEYEITAKSTKQTGTQHATKQVS